MVVLSLSLAHTSLNAQIWKRVKDSVKHRKQYGIFGGISGVNNLNIEAGLFYNRYKFLYTNRRAVGIEVMVWPYRAVAPKISYHAQIFAYAHLGGQAGVYTDFNYFIPFLRPEIGYSYRKYLDLRVGRNLILPQKNDMMNYINKWQVSAICYLRVFSKKK